MTTSCERAKEIFIEALEHPVDERDAYLQGAYGENQFLRDEVLSLLRHHREGDEELPAAATISIPEDTPEHIGPYRILRVLGEGGMGIVYLAEQSEPIRRYVAIKVIKVGMDTRAVVGRFDAERQALALMNHPNIAGVIEAGTTPEGRPFFVMEYVDGVPITLRCDQARLTIRQRIELLIPVCHAVQHAHQKGLMHRDIKPSNVLVALRDNVLTPTIIDFGIAKATNAEVTAQTVFTEVGQLIGTPAYMSPEQAGAEPDVDARTDVYALGVLLYELCSGGPPFDSKSLRSHGYAEIQRTIREVEPPTPSKRVKRLEGNAGTVAHHRGVDVKSLCRELSNDLDWITMKAMAKERNRRYATPSELAADLRRFLAGHAVEAGPPSKRYRVRKFIRRHKGAVTGGALLVATLAFGVSVALVERSRAENEAETSRLVIGLLQELFRAADPDAGRGNSMTVRELLDVGGDRVRSELTARPLIRATLQYMIGEVYRSLGLNDEALVHAEEALKTREELLGPDALDVVASLISVGEVQFRKGNLGAAQQLLRTAERKARELGRDGVVWLGTALNRLGNLSTGRRAYDEAIRHLREALAIRQSVHGRKHEDVAETMTNLATALWHNGDFEEAEKQYRAALAMSRELLGNVHSQTAAIASNLGAMLSDHRASDAEAEQLSREALSMRRRIFGNEHQVVEESLSNLGGVLERNGNTHEAEPLLRAALEIKRKRLGENHEGLANTLNTLAMVLARNGKCEDAEASARKSMALFQAKLPPDATQCLAALDTQGTVYLKCGRLQEAEQLLVKAFEGLKDRTDCPPVIKDEILGHLVDLYESWETSQPGMGHLARASQYAQAREKLKATIGPSR